jgi:hypothetical protein
MPTFFDALLFPVNRIERGPDPGPFSDYRTYKPHLQRVFHRKCVYCRISDGFKGIESFGIDHYLPRSKFPHLLVTWENLFYSCNVCNAWKGESASTPELFLPNPCEHRMSEHVQYTDAGVETYTPHGDWLAELLHLGERQGLRDFILAALGKFLQARSELVRDLNRFTASLDTSHSREEQAALSAAIRDTTEELERVDSHIERLTGESVDSL